MKLSRIQLLAAGCCLPLFLAGCYTVDPKPPTAGRAQDYYRIVTADFEGKRIAEYVSEGPVKKSDDGFTFWAVQRRIFEPKEMEFRYPLGRQMTVAASNTVSVPACKPKWLECLDGEIPAAECRQAPRTDCPKRPE